jgi:hypothetical protein
MGYYTLTKAYLYTALMLIKTGMKIPPNRFNCIANCNLAFNYFSNNINGELSFRIYHNHNHPQHSLSYSKDRVLAQMYKKDRKIPLVLTTLVVKKPS